MDKQHWIFLSPHLDDVALSCGGLVWDLVNRGCSVEIWTLMAGVPYEGPFSDFAEMNHQPWGISGKEIVHARREEDKNACEVLGVKARHFDWLDCIYRVDITTGEPYVKDNVELFEKAPEERLVQAIRKKLKDQIPRNVKFALPMGLGDHIDHRVVVQAVSGMKMKPFYYADYPYVLKSIDPPRTLSHRWKRHPHDLREGALKHWQESVLCYTTQLSGFWRDEEETRLALKNFMAGGGGRLWQKTTAVGTFIRKVTRKIFRKNNLKFY